MYRYPEPLTLDGLQGLMRDRRYTNPLHPEHESYARFVREGFERLYPGPGRADATGRLIDDEPKAAGGPQGAGQGSGKAGGAVQVRAYTQVRDGKTIEVSAHSRAAAWSNRANADFRQRIAAAEHSAGKPNHGYGERNPASNALGRYQMTPGALEDIEWRTADGAWTEKARAHGVASDADFLDNPEAQEEAMDRLMRRYEVEAEEKGLFDRVGEKIDGRVAPIEVTEAGVVAAVHRGGATGTRDYFEKIDRAGGDSGKADLTDDELAIETRLRTFQDAEYRRSRRQ